MHYPSNSKLRPLLALAFSLLQRYACDATQYWNRMKDLKDDRVKMTHDGYLKLFQLSKPTLGLYDIILVDEAQDLTPGG